MFHVWNVRRRRDAVTKDDSPLDMFTNHLLFPSLSELLSELCECRNKRCAERKKNNIRWTNWITFSSRQWWWLQYFLSSCFYPWNFTVRYFRFLLPFVVSLFSFVAEFAALKQNRFSSFALSWEWNGETDKLRGCATRKRFRSFFIFWKRRETLREAGSELKVQDVSIHPHPIIVSVCGLERDSRVSVETKPIIT